MAILTVRRVLLIANPAARRGTRKLDDALAALRSRGVHCDAHVTQYAGHAAELAASLAPGYDATFALGGDGTAMDVVGALAGTDRFVGILPGGTGNLIARSLGIPRALDRAVPMLLDGVRGKIDLGALGTGRRFAFTAGIGIDARMIELTPARAKRRLGVFAYALSAWQAMVRHRPFHLRATVDGITIERQATAVMVANFGVVLDDLFAFGPNIKYDDGLLDLCVFSPKSFAETARIMWRLSRKDFRSDENVVYRAGRQFRIETDPPQAVQADGELIGTSPFEASVEPLAASLLIPRR